MLKIRRIFFWIFLLLIFLMSVIFAFFNTTPVALSFGFVEFSAQPLAVWVVLAFSLGGFSGLVLGTGLFRNLHLRLEVRSLRKRLDEAERKSLALVRVREDAHVIDGPDKTVG